MSDGKPYGRFIAYAIDETGMCLALNNKLQSIEAARQWVRDTLNEYHAKQGAQPNGKAPT